MNLKYRTGDFEIFSNFTYNTGKSWEKKSTDMVTLTKSEWNQQLSTVNTKHYNGVLGKLGFSWIIGNKHSIGAFYQNEFAKMRTSQSLKVMYLRTAHFTTVGILMLTIYPKHTKTCSEHIL